MMTKTQTESYKARKVHICSWCAEGIHAGEEYLRYRCFIEGDASTVKMHQDCYTAMGKAISEEPGRQLEWAPGDYPRGGVYD